MKRIFEKGYLIRLLPGLVSHMAAFLISGIFFSACSNQRAEKGKTHLPEQAASANSGSGETKTAIFETAYAPKNRHDKSSHEFYQREIGKIRITTGKIIVTDPIMMEDAEALTIDFPIGEFPLQTAHSRAVEGRTAFIRILFNENPVEKWELVLFPGKNFPEMTDTTFDCFGVDAGTGVIMDQSACTFYLKNEDIDQLWELNDKNNYRPYMHQFDRYNLACFETGWGDGCYETYVGYDRLNQICRLIVDFKLTDWSSEN